MTREQQRIAILDACLWLREVDPRTGTISDPLSDLNAMREAEQMLTDEQYDTFWSILAALAAINAVARVKRDRNLLSASSSKRAEAFLRTIGKWKS